MILSIGRLLMFEIRQQIRQITDIVSVIMFFVLSVTLFPLGIGPEPMLLARISAGIIWATALLASMLSLDRLFATDYDDGMLDHLFLARYPLVILISTKLAAHWLLTGLPLLMLTPVLASMLYFPAAGYQALLIGIGLGTLCLSLLGGLGAALTLGARRNTALVPLLILPLALPILIFGVSAAEAAVVGLSPRPHLLILGAYLVLALPSLPLATAAALRGVA